MARITNLATEILFLILAIGDGQLTSRDVASVARTCKVLCHIATTLLYRHNISEHLSSALIWASRNNQIRTVQKALAFGADVNTFGLVGPTNGQHDSTYGTPLHWAARRGHDDVVRLLLDHNARLDAHSRAVCQCVNVDGSYHSTTPDPRPRWFPLHGSGPTILHCAAAQGLDSVVRRPLDIYPGILDVGKRRDAERSIFDVDFIASPLHYAINCRDSKSVIRTLVSAGCDLEAEDYLTMTLIRRACLVGNFAAAMHLLYEGAQTRRAPIRTSAYSLSEHSGEQLGRTSLLWYAVRGRSHIKACGRYPVVQHHEQVAFVKALIEDHGHTVHEVFLERERQMPLNAAIEPQWFTDADALPALIRLLLQKGADPNYTGVNKLSPLYRVIQHLLDVLRDTPSPDDCHGPYVDFHRETAETSNLELENDFTGKYGWWWLPKTPSWNVHDEEIYKDAAQTSIEDMDTNCRMNINPWLDAASRAGCTDPMARWPANQKSDAWEVMAELLKAGARLDTQFTIRFSPLCLAVLSASRDPSKEYSYTLLKFLLENRSSGTLSRRCLDKLLRICIELGHSYRGREAVSCLLTQHGASVDFQSPTVKELLQRRFIEYDDVWLATLCFQKNCLLHPPEDILINALENNSRRVARHILAKSGVSISKAAQQYNGNTALHVAALKADFDLALFLITRGADIRALNAYGDSPLYQLFCERRGKPSIQALMIARLLVDNGADPFRWRENDDPTQCICKISTPYILQANGSPFFYMLESYGIQGLHYFLENYQLCSQHPCIMCSCLRSMSTVYSADPPPCEVVDLLLKAGACPNGCGLCAESPITSCAEELRSEVTDKFWTKHSRLRLLQSLIAGGADVNQPNAEGETAATIIAEILSSGHRSGAKEAWDLFVNEVRKFFALNFDDSGKATITCLLL
ncbi:ankyrin repeat-containing domain protein [Xylaria sp. FL0064]|nr:ankyrin repeat-containing domain protein [Xylaria sp. FL0064]